MCLVPRPGRRTGMFSTGQITMIITQMITTVMMISITIITTILLMIMINNENDKNTVQKTKFGPTSRGGGLKCALVD